MVVICHTTHSHTNGLNCASNLRRTQRLPNARPSARNETKAKVATAKTPSTLPLILARVQHYCNTLDQAQCFPVISRATHYRRCRRVVAFCDVMCPARQCVRSSDWSVGAVLAGMDRSTRASHVLAPAIARHSGVFARSAGNADVIVNNACRCVRCQLTTASHASSVAVCARLHDDVLYML